MVHEELVTYQGYHNQRYNFVNDTSLVLQFARVRNELVWEFELHTTLFVGKKFRAKYILLEDNYEDVLILTDLFEA